MGLIEWPGVVGAGEGLPDCMTCLCGVSELKVGTTRRHLQQALVGSHQACYVMVHDVHLRRFPVKNLSMNKWQLGSGGACAHAMAVLMSNGEKVPSSSGRCLLQVLAATQ